MDRQNRSPAALLALGTAVPPYQARQEDIAQWMITSLSSRPALERLVRGLYASSGIDLRHSCIEDFLHPPEHSHFAPGQPLEQVCTTAERMLLYERAAPPLAAVAASRALEQLAERNDIPLPAATASISHLIVATCTGFFAPGLDLALARQLNLAPSAERTVVGFMGCSAAFNALRMAHHIVRSQPAARVLIVCVELCSLHIQPGAHREDLIAGSLFADGAAACVVGSAHGHQGDAFRLDSFYSEVKPDTDSDMVWQIGNYGFALRLSPQVPKHLATVAPAALHRLCQPNGPATELGFWAIHPGGPAIIERLAAVFDLAPEQTEASRSVLRRYGNMSSGTILFVLAEVGARLRTAHTCQTGVAMAFGPGLVIEMAQLTYLPARTKIL